LSGAALLAAAALPVLLGLLGSRLAAGLAAPEDGLLYRCTVYVLAGTVVLHLVLTLLDFAGIPWHPLLLLALWAALYFLGRHFLPRGPERSGPAMEAGWGEGTALAVLTAFTLLAITGWITFGDFVFHWGIKGERFYLARGVDYEYLSRGWNWAIHPDYPNLLPEMYAVISLMARRFDADGLMLTTALFCALTLAAVREGLRQGGAGRFTRQTGLALIALVAGAFGIGYTTAGGADWMLALALAAAAPPLFRPPDRVGDFQIGVIAAFAAAAKMEGVPLAAFLVLAQWGRRAWTERRPAFGAALRAGLPLAAVTLPWLGRVAHHHLFLGSNAGRIDLDRAPRTVEAMLEVIRTTGPWHGFLPAAFLPFLLLVPRRTRPLAAVAALLLAFDLYVYVSSPMADQRYFVVSNFARLGFQIVPASLVMALVAWGPPERERAGTSPAPTRAGA
jgi:hypothetical protein